MRVTASGGYWQRVGENSDQRGGTLLANKNTLNTLNIILLLV